MSLCTKEPRYQTCSGVFVWGLPGKIRCRPKHSTTLVASLVAVRRTPSTQTFLSQLIVPTKLNIQRYISARNPLRMGTQDFCCFHVSNVGLPGEHLSPKVANAPPCSVGSMQCSLDFQRVKGLCGPRAFSQGRVFRGESGDDTQLMRIL